MPKHHYLFQKRRSRRRPLIDPQSLSRPDRRWLAQAASDILSALPRRDRLDRGEAILELLVQSGSAFGIGQVEIRDEWTPDELLDALTTALQMLRRAALGEGSNPLRTRLRWAGRFTAATWWPGLAKYCSRTDGGS